MSKLNLVVGENNSGKTTLLEALFLLVGISNPQLTLSINSLRYLDLIGDVSWKSFFKDLDLDNKISLSAKFNDESQRNLEIKPHSLVKQVIGGKDNISISSTATLEINGLIMEAKISDEKKDKAMEYFKKVSAPMLKRQAFSFNIK